MATNKRIQFKLNERMREIDDMLSNLEDKLDIARNEMDYKKVRQIRMEMSPLNKEFYDISHSINSEYHSQIFRYIQHPFERKLFLVKEQPPITKGIQLTLF